MGGVLDMGKNVWGLWVCFFNVIVNLKYISEKTAPLYLLI